MRSPLCTIIVLPERYLFGQGRGSALCIFALVLSSPSPIYLRTLLLGSFMAFPMELDLLPSVPRVWWPSMLALRRIHLHALCSQEGLGVA